MNLLNGEITFTEDPTYTPKIKRTKRIGIDYAKHWTNRLLRFIDLNAMTK